MLFPASTEVGYGEGHLQHDPLYAPFNHLIRTEKNEWKAFYNSNPLSQVHSKCVSVIQLYHYPDIKWREVNLSYNKIQLNTKQ